MLEKHHIIFKSQGGLDFPLNYKYLTSIEHRGNKSPHTDRATDLAFKEELEQSLRDVLKDEYYTLESLARLLELNTKQVSKAFKQVRKTSKGIAKEDVIFRLLGGRYYL